jgi:maleate isomerase
MLCKFLEHHGIHVVRLRNVEIVGKLDGAELNSVPLEVVASLAKDAAKSSDAEAVYIACTGLRSLEILTALEEDLGKPVLSANQVTMWHAQQLAGLNPRLPQLGSLFAAQAADGSDNIKATSRSGRGIALAGADR